MNGFMFGGYLMRRALEVAWLSAYRFGRAPAIFVGIDDVVFRKPVEVGKIVEYVGRVVYAADDGSLRVFVEAHKLSIRTGRREQTNDFHFIFRVQDPSGSPGQAVSVASGRAATAKQGGVEEGTAQSRQVQPESYEEGMLWLEGRRRWLNQMSTRTPSKDL